MISETKMIITLEKSHGRKALLLPMLCLFICINQLTHKKHSSKLRRNKRGWHSLGNKWVLGLW